MFLTQRSVVTVLFVGTERCFSCLHKLYQTETFVNGAGISVFTGLIKFSILIFILSYRSARKQRVKCQLVNFIITQANLAVYVSHKNKIESNSDDDMHTVSGFSVTLWELIHFH